MPAQTGHDGKRTKCRTQVGHSVLPVPQIHIRTALEYQLPGTRGCVTVAVWRAGVVGVYAQVIRMCDATSDVSISGGVCGGRPVLRWVRLPASPQCFNQASIRYRVSMPWDRRTFLTGCVVIWP
jgi:hypothetical protein